MAESDGVVFSAEQFTIKMDMSLGFIFEEAKRLSTTPNITIDASSLDSLSDFSNPGWNIVLGRYVSSPMPECFRAFAWNFIVFSSYLPDFLAKLMKSSFDTC
ncbi:unnamed protein product, partial [Amaranthus hypochondriacus]